MKKKRQSFGAGLLARLGVEQTDFDSWPIEEVVLRLREDGVDVPPDSNPKDLVAFANSFYADAPVKPQRYTEAEVEFIDSSGIQYVARPRPPPPPTPLHDQQQQFNNSSSKKKNGEFVLDFSNQYHITAPPMFTAEMTDDELIRFREQRGSMLSPAALGAQEVEDEEDDPTAYFGEDAESEELRHDFRFMDNEDVTQNRLKSEFQRPSLDVARKFETLNHPRRNTGEKYSCFWTNTGRFCFNRGLGIFRFIDPLGEGSTSDLARYGIGISLHFKILKWLFWIYFIMTLITVPQMVLNSISGNRENSVLLLDTTMLGHITVENFFVNDLNGTIIRKYSNQPIAIPFSECGENKTVCYADRSTVAMGYTVSDLLAMFVFFLGMKWMQYFIRVEGARIAKHHITVEEYTIQVVRIPPTTTEWQLKKFFSDLTGEPVHEVFLVQDNGELLSLYVKRGKVINKLWKQAAEIHLLKEERKSKPGQRKAFTNDSVLQRRLDRAVKAYDRTFALFLNLNEQRAKKSPGTKALSAFVTFETQQGFLKAMDLYPQSFFAMRNQPPELRLDPKRPLKVRQAPPPTTILWENTHYNLASRQRRRLVTLFGTLVMLAISVVVCFFTERERFRLKHSIFEDSCAIVNSENNVLLSSNSTLTELATTLSLIQQGDETALNLAWNDEALRNCYCSSLTFSEAVGALFSPDSLCYTYYSIKSPLYALTFAATAVIAAVNILLQQVIFYFSIFERHHSLVNMELSIAKRVFVVLFVNTGLILMSVNAQFPGGVWAGSGSFADFSSSWYPSVGTNIFLTMCLNVVTPQLFPFAELLYHKYRLRTHVAFSQRELNEMHLGNIMRLSYRSAQMLMTVFVTMLYSSGMPILYPIACAFFIVSFYSDKYLMLHFYRTPPAYSERVAMWFTSMLPYAVICHLAFATWMYSAPGIFWDGESFETSPVVEYFGFSNVTQNEDGFNFDQRLSMAHILPLYVTLFVIILTIAFSFCFRSFDRIRSVCCATMTCGIFDDGTIKRRYLNPDYTEAAEQGELRGLLNYNILENPTYSRALGIDAKFAKEHRHVASVHEASAVDLPVLPQTFRVEPKEEFEKRRSKLQGEEEQRRTSKEVVPVVVGFVDDEEEASHTNNNPVEKVKNSVGRDRAGSAQREVQLSSVFGGKQHRSVDAEEVEEEGGDARTKKGLARVFNVTSSELD